MKLSNWKRWSVGAGFLFGLLIVAMLSLTIFSQTPQPAAAQLATVDPNIRKISVVVSKPVILTQDVATLNIGLIMNSSVASDALGKSVDLEKKVREAVVAVGVPDDAIQTQNTGVRTNNSGPYFVPTVFLPIATVRPVGTVGLMTPLPRPTSSPNFQASINLIVTINDTSKVGSVLDAVTKVGNTQLGGLFYAMRDESGPRSQALEQAMKDAQPKAQAVAKGMNAQLGQVLSVVESPNFNYSSYVQPGLPANSYEQVVVTYAIS